MTSVAGGGATGTLRGIETRARSSEGIVTNATAAASAASDPDTRRNVFVD